MALECRLPDYADTKRILFLGTASGSLPIYPVHKTRKLVLLGGQGRKEQTRRKSKNLLYSSVFEAIFLENQGFAKMRVGRIRLSPPDTRFIFNHLQLTCNSAQSGR
jgi:hypothetical protein